MTQRPVRASEMAVFLGLPLHGEDIEITQVASLANIKGNSLVFVKTPDSPWTNNLFHRKDIVAILPKDWPHKEPMCPRFYSDNPRLSFAQAVKEFFVEKVKIGISPLALVSEKASIGKNVSIGPYTIVEEGVSIGDDTEIRNNVLIKKGTVIEKNCIIRAFAVIGEEGFGFERDELHRPVRLPHIGEVLIQESVEIGNFCTICKGTIDKTIIGKWTKIDDHCHVAHNVKIGENVLITAGVVLSGSCTIGNNVWLGPNSTILNGLKVADNATVGLGSVVIRTVPENSHVLGNPAVRNK